MKVRYKANGMAYLDVRLPDGVGGLKRVRVSLDTKDRAEAEAQKRDWLAGVHPKHPAQGGVIAAKGRGPEATRSTRSTSRKEGMTLDNWLRECEDTLWRGCKGRATIRSNIAILCAVIDPDALLKDTTSITIGEIERALRSRRNYAEGSIKKLMGALSAALSYATEQDDPKTGLAYLPVKPRFPTYVVRNVRDRVLSEAEEQAVMAAIEARQDAEPGRPWRHFGALITLLLDTGFRIGEALSLGQRSVRTKRWIDRMTGEPVEAVYIGLDRYATKTDKPREVPMTRRVQELRPLLDTLAVRGRWFPWAPKSGGPGYLWSNIRDDLKASGYDISDVTLHTMRHTCATRLAQGGMDLLGLRDWLGHTDIKITADRYIHLMSSHLYQGAAILDLSAGTYPAGRVIDSGGGGGCDLNESLPYRRDHAAVGTAALQ